MNTITSRAVAKWAQQNAMCSSPMFAPLYLSRPWVEFTISLPRVDSREQVTVWRRSIGCWRCWGVCGYIERRKKLLCQSGVRWSCQEADHMWNPGYRTQRISNGGLSLSTRWVGDWLARRFNPFALEEWILYATWAMTVGSSLQKFEGGFMNEVFHAAMLSLITGRVKRYSELNLAWSHDSQK